MPYLVNLLSNGPPQLCLQKIGGGLAILEQLEVRRCPYRGDYQPLERRGPALPEKNQNFTIGGKTEKKERVKNDRKTVQTID